MNASGRVDQASGPGDLALPRLLVFDVNETLSDMAPLGRRFEDVGVPAYLAGAWMAGLLRDGFALTVAGENPSFASLGYEGLRSALHGVPLNRPLEEACEHIMAGISELRVHQDVPGGVRALAGLGCRLVTLSNGAATIARRLLVDAGLDAAFESLLSVEQAGIWKPSASAYAHALTVCEVSPAEAMLVAAHPWDIDGAGRAGLATAWINRSGGHYPGYFQPSDVEAASLTHLADRLARVPG
jgi:2-haloacid dehalogenase